MKCGSLQFLKHKLQNSIYSSGVIYSYYNNLLSLLCNGVTLLLLYMIKSVAKL